MNGIGRQIMRIVLVALLFQFVSPVFLSVVTQNDSFTEDTHAVTLHAHHSSVIAPQLLKEKDETETKVDELVISLFTLIDFSDHSFVLTGLHETKITPFAFRDRFDHHPPLFTLHCVFLI